MGDADTSVGLPSPAGLLGHPTNTDSDGCRSIEESREEYVILDDLGWMKLNLKLTRSITRGSSRAICGCRLRSMPNSQAFLIDCRFSILIRIDQKRKKSHITNRPGPVPCIIKGEEQLEPKLSHGWCLPEARPEGSITQILRLAGRKHDVSNERDDDYMSPQP